MKEAKETKETKEKNKKMGKNTQAVHSGEKRDPQTGAVNTPIYLTSTFGFDKVEHQKEAVENRKARYLYSRWGNPTVDATANKISALEGAEETRVVASGMAAISSVVLGTVKAGEHIVTIEDLYGGTLSLMNDLLPRFNIETTYVKTGDSQALEKAIKPNTKLIYLETPTNPLVNLINLKEIAEIAQERGITTVCDNTFATPINQQPIKEGIDLVVHSATKYLAGHSDIIAGSMSGSEEKIDQLWSPTISLGGNLNANSAWLLLRGLKTLGVRVQRHNENAQAIAEFLEGHPKVRKVYYPGLESHPQKELAKKQMRGFGGMMSVELEATMEETKNFLETVELFDFAPSLGGVESLITQPAITSHSYLTQEERDHLGISDSLLRVSIGIEDKEDLIAALEEALAKIN